MLYSIEDLQKIQEDERLQDLEWSICYDNPHHFLINWAQTLDSHDEGKQTVKTFPNKEYIKQMVNLWLTENLLLVPKSRQMMMSWLFTSLYLWDTMFHQGRLTFFQSKKADDADDLVKRSKFVWDHLPKFLKRYYHNGKFHNLECNPQNRGQHVYCKMMFPDINSEIRGIPEGGDIIRMHTASGILADEMAFQPEAEAAYTAAKPTLSSKGRFTGLSTAEDNTFFQDLVMDKNLE
jgi:hypothetical protein